MRVLVTRPEPDNERTAAKLRARGIDVLLAPMLEIEVIPAPDFGAGPWTAVLMTSANAAYVIPPHRRRAELVGLPVFVVGRRTATAARLAGFSEVISADGAEKDLVRLILSRFEGKRVSVLYLAGEERTGGLERDLTGAGIRLSTVVTYRATKASALPVPVQNAIRAGSIDGVLHFSRRSAEAYVDCAKFAGLLARALVPTHYCLSRQVAEPLTAVRAGDVRVAPRPEENLLIDSIPSK